MYVLKEFQKNKIKIKKVEQNPPTKDWIFDVRRCNNFIGSIEMNVTFIVFDIFKIASKNAYFCIVLNFSTIWRQNYPSNV